jgi:hypothetical protein
VTIGPAYDDHLGTRRFLEEGRHGFAHCCDQSGKAGHGGAETAVLETAQVRRGDAGEVSHLARRHALLFTELAQARTDLAVSTLELLGHAPKVAISNKCP